MSLRRGMDELPPVRVFRILHFHPFSVQNVNRKGLYIPKCHILLMPMMAKAKTRDPVREVIPWAVDNPLERVDSMRREEIRDVLEMLDSLTLTEVPEEVEGIVKRPAWERLLV